MFQFPKSARSDSQTILKERLAEVFDADKEEISERMKKLDPSSDRRVTMMEEHKEQKLRPFFEHLHRALRISPEVHLSVHFLAKKAGCEFDFFDTVTHDFAITTPSVMLMVGSLQQNVLRGAQVTLDSGSPILTSQKHEIPGRSEVLAQSIERNERIARLNLPDKSVPSSLDKYLDDRGLAHLGQVFEQLKLWERDPQRQPTVSSLYAGVPAHSERIVESRRAEAAAAISRLLVSRGFHPTEMSLSQVTSELIQMRQEVHSLAFLDGRNVVIGAGAEIRKAYVGNSPGEEDLGSGAFRFGQPRLMEEIQANGGTVREIARQEPSKAEQLHGLLNNALPVLSRIDSSIEDLLPRERSERKTFLHDISDLFGRPAEILQVKVISLGARKDLFISDRERNTTLYSGALKEVSFLGEPFLGAIEDKIIPAQFLIPPPKERVDQRILKAIDNCVPGRNGFAFIFDGHGSREAISFTGGAEGGDLRITGKELADAVKSRHQKFGSKTDGDLYVISACSSHDFVREVCTHLSDSQARPIFLSVAEAGQFGFSSGYSCRALTEIFTTAQRLRNEGRAFSFGDLIQLLGVGQEAKPYSTNPTLFLPRRERLNEGGEVKTRFHPVSALPNNRLSSSRETAMIS